MEALAQAAGANWRVPGRTRVGPRLLIGVMLAGAVAVILHESPLHLGGSTLDTFLNTWIYNGVLVLAAVACAGRAIMVPSDRAPWACIGLSLGLWAAADIYWSAVIEPMQVEPYPSFADALWIASYVPYYVGLLLFVRDRVLNAPLGMWLDGAIGGLAMAALAAAVLTPALVGLTTGDIATVATNVAYPLADILLLMFLVGATTVIGFRGGLEWPLISAALLVLATADSIYLIQIAEGTYTQNSLLDGLWLVNASLLAIAAWAGSRAPPVQRHAYHSLALPTLFGVVAVGVLVYQLVVPIGSLGEGLAVAALGAMVVRLLLAFDENARLLQAVQHESVTDALTGLGNRRLLLADLEHVLADGAGAAPRLFGLFDLDGFKNYNDRFGHPAGDALLNRLGKKLSAAVGPGDRAYRLGGDEFCVLLDGGKDAHEVLAEAAIALYDVGDGFVVSNSHGAVELPSEAQNPAAALRLADGRMYARKRGRRRSTERQARDLLLSAQVEQEPELGPHLMGVAAAAESVGRCLGVEGEELEVLIRAAELHDIGKIAIPEDLLHSSESMDEAGTELIHQHTLIGERILAAAPAMVPVSKLVRSSHERWDGSGYPDGLSAEEIPLGSRIILACDAYDAMRSDRPYSPSISHEEAAAELERNAGTQFDPRIVRTLCDVLEGDDAGVAREPIG